MQPLDFGFLVHRYDFELQRKEQLTAALNLPVGALGALGGLLALMARSFTYGDAVLTWTFVPPLVVAIVAFFACLLQVARAYHSQTYIYLPLLGEMESARREFDELKRWEAMGGDENDDAMETFASDFRRRIIEASDRNTENNDERSSLLYWARVWLFVLLGFAALAGISYVSDQVRGAFSG